MRLNIERKDIRYIATAAKSGWKLTWLDVNACGVSPRLAFKEALYVLALYEDAIHTHRDEAVAKLKELYNGHSFKITLISFPHHPTVQVEVVNGSCEAYPQLHAICKSIQETQRTAMTQFVKREDGQYTVVVKELDVPDRNGRVWTKEAMQKALENPNFADRLEHGVLFGELGQPNRYVGQSEEAFRQRVWTVKYDNVCVIASDARINEQNQLTVVVRPGGRWQGSLEQMLSDQVPLTLGIRAFTDDMTNGEVKNIKLVTFDVIDPQ